MFFIHLKEQVQPFICQSVYTGNAVCFWLTENNRFIIAICSGTGQHFAPDVSDPINIAKKNEINAVMNKCHDLVNIYKIVVRAYIYTLVHIQLNIFLLNMSFLIQIKGQKWNLIKWIEM